MEGQSGLSAWTCPRENRLGCSLDGRKTSPDGDSSARLYTPRTPANQRKNRAFPGQAGHAIRVIRSRAHQAMRSSCLGSVRRWSPSTKWNSMLASWSA